MSKLADDKHEIAMRILEHGMDDRNLVNQEYMKKFADQNNFNEEIVLGVGIEMLRERNEEYDKREVEHLKRVHTIIANMNSNAGKVRKGDTVAMFIGADNIRIVRVESQRGGRIYGNTVDAFEPNYIDEWPSEDIITSVDQINK